MQALCLWYLLEIQVSLFSEIVSITAVNVWNILFTYGKVTNSRLSSVVSTQSTTKIEELIQEDHNVKRKREKFKLQSSLLSKVTRLLSIHDSRSANASWSNDSAGSGKSIPFMN